MTDDEALAVFQQHALSVRARCAARPSRNFRMKPKRAPKPIPPPEPPVIRRPRFNKDGKMLLWLKRRDVARVKRYQEAMA